MLMYRQHSTVTKPTTKGKRLISLILVCILASLIVFVTASSPNIDSQCGVDLTYQKAGKKK